MKLREMYPNKFFRNMAEGKKTEVKIYFSLEGKGK